MNTRAIAAQVILQVISKKSALDVALQNYKLGAKPEDQKFIHELSYGTIRWYYRLNAIATKLLHKPLSNKDQDVLCLLLVGLYQLAYLQTPAYAAISATVEGARALKKSWATGLVNKILRLFQRTQEEILASVDKKPELKYAVPDWLFQKIKSAWPKDWGDILTANNTPAPMTLRINPQKTNIEQYLALLSEQQIEGVTIPDLTYGIQLKEPVSVSQLPRFEQGYCYVQDQAGQYATKLLQLKDGLRVLDACAAPGSKTTDILASYTLEKLIAIEKNPERMQKIQENIHRLQLSTENVELLTADSTDIQKWWDNRLFDRILIDAPCSATGVIRRHPDIKLLRQPGDIHQQKDLQLKLLKSLWITLKPEGLLLYSTCSILPEENEKVIASFLQNQSEAHIQRIQLGCGLALKYGIQILPRINGPDGFYYALIKKISL